MHDERPPVAGAASAPVARAGWRRVPRSATATASIATVCLVGGALATVGGLAARHEASDANTAVDATEVVRVRTELRRTHIGELNTLMLHEFGLATDDDIDDARTRRLASRATAASTLGRIADGDGPIALEASALLEHLDGDDAGEVTSPPMSIVDTSWTLGDVGRPPSAALQDSTRALHDLMLVDIVGAGVLNDALDATYTVEQPTVDPSMADYVAESEPYIRSDGGYLGPDAADPLAGSYVYSPTVQVPHPGVAEVRGFVVTSGIWAHDQWVRSWQEGTPVEPAPYELADLVDRITVIDRQVHGVVDDAIAAELDARTDSAASAQGRALALLGLAALLLAVPVTVLARTIRRRFRAVTEVAAQVSIDPLTGVGNRHQLHHDTETHVAGSAHAWHLAAAVDMDRFKMINDTWGHAVGDRVLVEVARRLTAIVDGWRGSASGTTGTVIRLGGDEFLMTIHAPGPINVDIVREQLDEIRTSSITVERDGEPDEQVALSFSLGVATADAPVELDDLMRAADLAAYEEKARRRASMPDRRRTVVQRHGADAPPSPAAVHDGP